MSRLLCVLACLLPLSAHALDPDARISQYVHRAWRMRDGIFNGSANAITQTADGYLWIGTENGLIRFDGVRFAPWTPPAGQSLDARIFSVLGTKDGALWVGTGRGIARMKDGRVVEIDHSSRINSIVADRDGVWIARSRARDDKGPICFVTERTFQCRGTKDGITVPTALQVARARDGAFWLAGSKGLRRWIDGRETKFFESEFTDNQLFGVNAIEVAADGSIWASLEEETRAQLRHYVNGQWTGIELPRIDDANIAISALFVDRTGVLWIGTVSHGLFRLHNGAFDRFAMADGLSGDGVTALYQDHEGNLWVATTQGVDMFRDARVLSYSRREGLSADSVSSVAAGADGRVWAGNIGALDVLQNGKWSAVPDLPGRVVTSMFVDRAGRAWVGVDRTLWVYEQGKFREIKRPDGVAVGRILAIAEDEQSNIWVQGGTGLLRIHDYAVQQIIDDEQFPVVYVFAHDPREGVWFGAREGELLRYRKGTFERFPAPKEMKLGTVMGLVVDDDGTVWAAVKQGLVRLVGKERRLLGKRNGLPCEGYYAMQKDLRGTLWLYGQCGLVAISRAQLAQWSKNPATVIRPLVLDAMDGAQPGMATFQPSVTRTPDGRLWFANDRIVQMLDPARLRTNPQRPPVRIETITADRRAYEPHANLVLPALTRDLQIDYTALSFANPQKVRFRYRLENRDEQWQDAGTRRQVFYTDLRPGHYRFRVIACNEDGLWNESGATLDFHIAAAWYQTLWYRIVSVIAALAVLWLLYRLRVRRVASNLSARFDERLAERTRLARELHDTLLQTIQGSKMVADTLSQSNDATRLQRGVEQLSVWLAQAVQEGRAALNSLRNSTIQENDLAEAFRLAADSTLNPGIDVALNVSGKPVDMHPIVRDEIYHIGYEALRNAFMHSNAAHISIELRYDKEVTLRVADDGVGIAQEIIERGRPGHYGLQGMRERAARIKASLTLLPSTIGGTVMTLIVPGSVVYRRS